MCTYFRGIQSVGDLSRLVSAHQEGRYPAKGNPERLWEIILREHAIQSKLINAFVAPCRDKSGRPWTRWFVRPPDRDRPRLAEAFP